MTPKFTTKDLGDVLVTAISDGSMQVGFELLTNIDIAECEKIQRNAGIKEPNAIHINTFLIQKNGKNILIDSGIGGLNNLGGQLIKNLAELGIAPKDIDTVLLTHSHPDHIGGLITPQGNAVFSRAELLVSNDEYNYIKDEKKFSVTNDRIKGNFLLARKVFRLYQDRLQLIDKGEVLSGIHAIPLKGHTPGHTGYKIIGKNDELLVWGDIVHFPQIQLLKPNVSIAFDYDPQLAAETRINILDMVNSHHILVGGMHFGQNGFNYIKRLNTGYTLANE